MSHQLDLVRVRRNLKPRREPYWHRIAKGYYLGFRKLSKDTDGTWLARAYLPATGQQKYQPLGDFTEIQDFHRFDAALKSAQEWFAHLGKGGSPDMLTVREVCSRYVKDLRRRGQDAAAADAEKRFARYVLDDLQFADLEATKLTPLHFEKWRERLATRPTVVGKRKDGKPKPPPVRPRKPSAARLAKLAAAAAAEAAKPVKLRSGSTLNRDISPFRAALNLAKEDGYLTTDFAWKRKLEPLPNVERQRDLYLDANERRQLVASADPDMTTFLRALSALPLRPGALANLVVGDYERRLKVLRVGRAKEPGAATDKDRPPRYVMLPPETAGLFDAAVKGKTPAAPIFSRSNGKAWNKDSWKDPIKEAATRAGLPRETSAYTVRHSVITDLVHDGLDLLTVAQLAGTSVRMIEQHYGHLRQQVAAAALAKLSKR